MAWKTVKLGEIVILHDSKRVPLSSLERAKRKGNYPYYGAASIVDYIDSYIFDGDYILLGEDGTVINDNGTPVLQRPSGQFWVSNHAHVITNREGVDFDFLYYLLCNTNITSAVTGAVQMKVSQKNLLNIELPLPPLETQRRIAAILSSLDDKIENNNRINRNLEAQAQALFKSWFVDYEPWGGSMPEDWKFDDISNIPHMLETGRRPKGGAVESGVPSIGAEHIKGMGTYDFSKTKYISEEYARSLKTGKVNGYELLIYKDGGKPGYFIPNFTIYGEGYPFEDCYLNEHVLKLDFPSKAYNIFCYFYFQTSEVMNYLNAQGGKAAIPGINKSDIDNINILTPENEAVVQFGKIVLPYFTKILRNLAENHRLAALRDTLLPKLMRGEITL